MLKTIPDLTSQLLDEHLKVLSKNVISETWIKGSTGKLNNLEENLARQTVCHYVEFSVRVILISLDMLECTVWMSIICKVIRSETNNTSHFGN